MVREALLKEATYVQNPALGAVLLWRSSVGYANAHQQSLPMLLPLGFLILPLVLLNESRELQQQG